LDHIAMLEPLAHGGEGHDCKNGSDRHRDQHFDQREAAIASHCADWGSIVPPPGAPPRPPELPSSPSAPPLPLAGCAPEKLQSGFCPLGRATVVLRKPKAEPTEGIGVSPIGW